MKKRHVTQSNSSIKIWFSYTCSSIHTIFSQTVASFNLQSIFPNANGNDKITPYLVNKYIKDPLKGTHCEGTSYRRVPVLREHGPSTPRHPGWEEGWGLREASLERHDRRWAWRRAAVSRGQEQVQPCLAESPLEPKHHSRKCGMWSAFSRRQRKDAGHGNVRMG